MSLTKNLSRHEFACQCGCGFDAADIELLGLIQKAGDHFKEMYKADKVYINITSGNRCAAHNAMEGGVPKSQHVFGIAADHRIKVKINGAVLTVSAKELSDYYDRLRPTSLGIGIYPDGRVHLDVRGSPARWDNGS